MRRWTFAALGALMLALLLWLWPMAEQWQDRASGPSTAVAGASLPNRAAIEHDRRSDHDLANDTPSTREQVAVHDQDAEPGEWTLRLLGIDPDVPWTAPLDLVFEDRLLFRTTVDAHGTSRFVPPSFARLPGITNMLVIAHDDHYILERAHQVTATLQMTGHLELAVYPISVLGGRVLGPEGTGIVARVRAFAWVDGGPSDNLLARTESQPDGTYQVRVPAGVPLLLLAEALAANSVLELWPNQQSPVLLDFGKAVSLDELNEFDARQPRADLLPATLRAEATHLTTRTVADMRLSGTAVLTGRVTFADGQPLGNIDVVAQPAWATQGAWHDNLHWSPTEGLARGAATHTDERGVFTLQLAAGVQFLLHATGKDPLLLAGEPSATASAPGFAELIAPGDLVTFRAIAAGQPVPHATLDIDDHAWPTDGRGQRRVMLGPRPTRARARASVSASAWVALPPDAHPHEVQLELITPELAEVRIALRSDPKLLAAAFTWQPLPEGAQFSISTERERTDLPFVVTVPPGNYRLTMRGSDEAPGGEFLLPLQVEVSVPPAGLAIEHSVVFGGKIAINLRNANGSRPAGTFSLRNAAGQEVTPGTITYDGRNGVAVEPPGVLQQAGVNNLAGTLPPGEYSLVIDLRGGTRIARTVKVTAWATTGVSMRLP